MRRLRCPTALSAERAGRRAATRAGRAQSVKVERTRVDLAVARRCELRIALDSPMLPSETHACPPSLPQSPILNHRGQHTTDTAVAWIAAILPEESMRQVQLRR